LEPCRKYTYSIQAIYNGKAASNNARIEATTKEGQISQVENVELEIQESSVDVSWSTPTTGPLCIAKYKVVLGINPTGQIEELTTEVNDGNKYSFNVKRENCVTYSVIVTPITLSAIRGPETRKEEKNEMVDEIEYFKMHKYENGTVKFDVEVENKHHTRCQHKREINCTDVSIRKYT
jgi:hypothetical protein